MTDFRLQNESYHCVTAAGFSNLLLHSKSEKQKNHMVTFVTLGLNVFKRGCLKVSWVL